MSQQACDLHDYSLRRNSTNFCFDIHVNISCYTILVKPTWLLALYEYHLQECHFIIATSLDSIVSIKETYTLRKGIMFILYLLPIMHVCCMMLATCFIR